VLHELVDTGNTVVVIEDNLEVIKTADRIIDLGPEARPGLDPGACDGGGEIVAAGPPEESVKVKRSYTRQFLASWAASIGLGQRRDALCLRLIALRWAARVSPTS
jgi:excinuclease ABC subunit A